jgi:hypothetical protein
MKRADSFFTWMLAALAAALSGCGESLFPAEKFTTTHVSGVVREGGEPVVGGWIEFFPVEGTTGNVCSAPIHSDGTFQADCVPVGRVSVGFVGRTMIRALRYKFRPFLSDIRRDIPPQGTTSLTIDFLEEAVLSEQKKSKAG